MTVGDGGLEAEAALLRDGEGDGAVVVVNGGIAQRRQAGKVDGAVVVADGDAAGDVLEQDVVAVGGEGDGATAESTVRSLPLMSNSPSRRAASNSARPL